MEDNKGIRGVRVMKEAQNEIYGPDEVRDFEEAADYYARLNLGGKSKYPDSVPIGLRSVAEFKMTRFALIMLLFLLIPVFLLGYGVFRQLMSFLSNPFLTSYVPIWVIGAGVVLFLIFLRRTQ